MKFEFTSIRVALAKHGLLFRDKHFALSENFAMRANDPLERNNNIKACLINLNILLYHSFSLNICEYPQNH